MTLSSDLVSQFVKATKDDKKSKSESIVYGTAIVYNGSSYVKIDGSDLLTPVSTTTVVKNGERVSVMIKDHTATITGNISSPSAQNSDLTKTNEEVDAIKKTVGEFDVLIAKKADISDLEANYAHITDGVIDNAKIDQADVNNLDANYAHISDGVIDNATIDQAKVNNLSANYAHISDGVIDNAQINHANVKDLNTTYATLDFANINTAAVQKVFSDSGIIKDLIVSDGKITGELVGVTIKGDLIEANSLKADKLVVLGEDGLYYKLNVNALGETTASSDPKYQNGLDGSNIIAQSITAEKVAVDDLVAFGANIGGWEIGSDSLHTVGKESATSGVRGTYLGSDGSFGIGSGSSFIRYYWNEEEAKWKIELQADAISIGVNSVPTNKDVITSEQEEFYESTSPTELSGGSWSTTIPTWTEGTYIWRRTLLTYGNGDQEYRPSSTGVCIMGNTGAQGEKGEDAVTLRIDSSRGTLFKNNMVSTVLSVTIYKGSEQITNITKLHEVFGYGAYLEWSWQKIDEELYGTILSTDKMVGNDGFTLTVSPDEVDRKVTFKCELNY